MIENQLKALLRLQSIDLTLLQLKKEAQGIPERKAQMTHRADKAQARLAEAKTALRTREAEIKELEMETQAVRDKINRYRNQQLEAKTNETYKTLESEIGTAEAEITEIEDRELGLMETLEPLKAAVSAAEHELSKAMEAIDVDCKQLDVRLETVKEQFGELKAQRETLAEAVEPDILKRYLAHLGAKQDAWLVKIRQQTCGGCHMKLTPQILHDVHAMVRWTSCTFCGRMLYDDSMMSA